MKAGWVARRCGCNGGERHGKGHEAIHLVLLVDTLMDEYARSWESGLAVAYDKFSQGVLLDRKTRHAENPGEFWKSYDQWTRTNSDRAETIALRHQFFCTKMLQYLQPLQLKDPMRIYGPLERELIYHRDGKKCAVCGADVLWSEHEIHHVQQHSNGGPTTLQNGRLVHRHCHPKGASASRFAADVGT